MLGTHLVVGAGIGDRRIDQIGIHTQLGQQVTGNGPLVRLVSLDVQGPAGPGVPSVQVSHRLPPQQRTDAHH